LAISWLELLDDKCLLYGIHDEDLILKKVPFVKAKESEITPGRKHFFPFPVRFLELLLCLQRPIRDVS